MWAIIDARAPKEAINNLKKDFDVLEFSSSGITYKEVSGHPDIFIFQTENELIIAPNSPENLVSFLDKHKVKYTLGAKPVGEELDNSTQYNCIVTQKQILHKKGYTDKSILNITKNLYFTELPQAYTRCSLTMLDDNNFITSDKGIEKVLKNKGANVFSIDAKQILLPGFKNGFYGGTNGIFEKKLFQIGRIKNTEERDNLNSFLKANCIELVELYDGDLYDGGGLFFGK